MSLVKVVIILIIFVSRRWGLKHIVRIGSSMANDSYSGYCTRKFPGRKREDLEWDFSWFLRFSLVHSQIRVLCASNMKGWWIPEPFFLAKRIRTVILEIDNWKKFEKESRIYQRNCFQYISVCQIVRILLSQMGTKIYKLNTIWFCSAKESKGVAASMSIYMFPMKQFEI